LSIDNVCYSLVIKARIKEELSDDFLIKKTEIMKFQNFFNWLFILKSFSIILKLFNKRNWSKCLIFLKVKLSKNCYFIKMYFSFLLNVHKAWHFKRSRKKECYTFKKSGCFFYLSVSTYILTYTGGVHDRAVKIVDLKPLSPHRYGFE
jgi:hypothetical protein